VELVGKIEAEGEQAFALVGMVLAFAGGVFFRCRPGSQAGSSTAVSRRNGVFLARQLEVLTNSELRGGDASRQPRSAVEAASWTGDRSRRLPCHQNVLIFHRRQIRSGVRMVCPVPIAGPPAVLPLPSPDASSSVGPVLKSTAWWCATGAEGSGVGAGPRGLPC